MLADLSRDGPEKGLVLERLAHEFAELTQGLLGQTHVMVVSSCALALPALLSLVCTTNHSTSECAGK